VTRGGVNFSVVLRGPPGWSCLLFRDGAAAELTGLFALEAATASGDSLAWRVRRAWGAAAATATGCSVPLLPGLHGFQSGPRCCSTPCARAIAG